MREPINLYDDTLDALVKMSEGNIGAITVLMQLVERDDPAKLMVILDLDDMNIRGSQIWVGFKDACGEDIEAFTTAIKNRDPLMIDKINEQCYHPKWDGDDYMEEAHA